MRRLDQAERDMVISAVTSMRMPAGATAPVKPLLKKTTTKTL